MKTIDIVSTARSEFNHCYSIATILDRNGFNVRLILSGSHKKEFNQNSGSVEGVSFPIVKLDSDLSSDDLASKTEGLARMTVEFSLLWADGKTDMVLFVGDRYELLAPATVALLANIPIVHAYGGECDVSYCIDTAVRNSLTSMASMHLVAHDEIKKRLISLGEEPSRIHVIGNVALNEISDIDSSYFLAHAEKNGWGKGSFVTACYLPSTTLADLSELDIILDTLEEYSEYTFIWAGVNSDVGSEKIRNRLITHCNSHDNHFFTEGLGRDRFFGLLSESSFMIGNSSSGFLEAASFKLPVINIGTRQTGRLAGDSVINISATADLIKKAISDLTSRYSGEERDNIQNPFYEENLEHKLVDCFKSFQTLTSKQKLIKRYVEGNPSRVGQLVRCKEIK